MARIDNTKAESPVRTRGSHRGNYRGRGGSDRGSDRGRGGHSGRGNGNGRGGRGSSSGYRHSAGVNESTPPFAGPSHGGGGGKYPTRGARTRTRGRGGMHPTSGARSGHMGFSGSTDNLYETTYIDEFDSISDVSENYDHVGVSDYDYYNDDADDDLISVSSSASNASATSRFSVASATSRARTAPIITSDGGVKDTNNCYIIDVDLSDLPLTTDEETIIYTILSVAKSHEFYAHEIRFLDDGTRARFQVNEKGLVSLNGLGHIKILGIDCHINVKKGEWFWIDKCAKMVPRSEVIRDELMVQGCGIPVEIKTMGIHYQVLLEDTIQHAILISAGRITIAGTPFAISKEKPDRDTSKDIRYEVSEDKKRFLNLKRRDFVKELNRQYKVSLFGLENKENGLILTMPDMRKAPELEKKLNVFFDTLKTKIVHFSDQRSALPRDDKRLLETFLKAIEGRDCVPTFDFHNSVCTLLGTLAGCKHGSNALKAYLAKNGNKRRFIKLDERDMRVWTKHRVAIEQSIVKTYSKLVKIDRNSGGLSVSAPAGRLNDVVEDIQREILENKPHREVIRVEEEELQGFFRIKAKDIVGKFRAKLWTFKNNVYIEGEEEHVKEIADKINTILSNKQIVELHLQSNVTKRAYEELDSLAETVSDHSEIIYIPQTNPNNGFRVIVVSSRDKMHDLVAEVKKLENLVNERLILGPEQVISFKKKNLRKMGDENDVRITLSGNKLNICGEPDAVVGIMEEFKGNLDSMKKVTRWFRPFSFDMNNMIYNGYRDRMDKLARDSKCDIDIAKFAPRGYKCIGQKRDVENLLENLSKLETEVKNSLKVEKLAFKPRIATRLKGSISKKLTNKHHVIIRWSSDETKTLASVTHMASNCTIQLRLGDITTSAVDAVVNAANANLDHGDGVAKAIARTAGDGFIHECKDLCKTETLNTTDAVVTSGGKLFARHVIHAVGPYYTSGSLQDITFLRLTVLNTLNCAEAKKCESIAFPLISSGIFGYPVDLSARVIFETIKEYLDTRTEKSSIKKIRVVENKEDRCKTALASLAGVSGQDSLSPITLLTSKLKINDDDNNNVNQTVGTTQPRTWYWKDDDDQWSQFRLDECKELNKHTTAGLKSFTLTVSTGESYTVDFERMVQINQHTNHTRSITDTIPMRTEGLWFWKDDKDTFSAYGHENCAKIENAYQEGHPNIRLALTRHLDDAMGDYLIQFDTNVQVNLKTGYKRIVKREESQRHESVRNLTVVSDGDLDDEPGDDGPVKAEDVVMYILGTRKKSKASVAELKKHANDLIETNDVSIASGAEIPVEFLDKLCVDYDIAIQKIDDAQAESITLRMKGLRNDTDDAERKISKYVITQLSKKTNGASLLPPEWTPFSSTRETPELVQLQPTSSEYQLCVTEMSKTLKAQIVRIERIQNKYQWQRYRHTLQTTEQKRGDANEKYLFHGSRGTAPFKIWKSDIGFDFRFSAKGLYGVGSYFAVNASYSDHYRSTDENGEHQMFLARVCVGQSVKFEKNSATTQAFRMPPMMNTNDDGTEDRYDSVEGHTMGSTIYIAYEHARMYPAFLITYKV